ncbi:hypothetical protein DYY66_1259 [Candidatus Nitrosotalea sp. FS]|nr:hypothetical protein [Candidatus Nitrosotalea sp. FS]
MQRTRKELNDDRQEKNSVSNKISLALIGMGNVSTTLVKGFEYYKNSTEGLWHPKIGGLTLTLVKGFEYYKNSTEGLWHPKIGGLTLNDFTVTAIYDIDAAKVGKNISSLINGSKSDFGNLIVQPGIADDVTPGTYFKKWTDKIIKL